MTTTLLVEFDIKPGRTDDFKQAAQALFDKTQGEPNTLRYEYFLSVDGTRNVNIEVFRDADAFVFHNRNVADLVPALFETLERVQIAVIGDANDDLWAELADVETVHYQRLGGITR
ncbi:MAG: antibiotic biosynthesis monooxygenase [Chloroflexota bacterium]|jgi:quinol monooxygenase YgiN